MISGSCASCAGGVRDDLVAALVRYHPEGSRWAAASLSHGTLEIPAVLPLPFIPLEIWRSASGRMHRTARKSRRWADLSIRCLPGSTEKRVRIRRCKFVADCAIGVQPQVHANPPPPWGPGSTQYSTSRPPRCASVRRPCAAPPARAMITRSKDVSSKSSKPAGLVLADFDAEFPPSPRPPWDRAVARARARRMHIDNAAIEMPHDRRRHRAAHGIEGAGEEHRAGKLLAIGPRGIFSPFPDASTQAISVNRRCARYRNPS